MAEGIRRADADQTPMNNEHRDEFMRQLVRHERLLHSFIFSMVLDWRIAEEILQETYLRLLECISEWDPGKDLYPWACRFAHFQVLSYRSRVRRDKIQFTDSFVDCVAQMHEHRTDQLKLRMEALEHCVERLPDQHQQLLKVAYHSDRSIDEAARSLGRTAVATYQSLTRIRRSLKQCVEKAIRSLE